MSSEYHIVDSEGEAAKSDQLKSGLEEGYQDSILIYKNYECSIRSLPLDLFRKNTEQLV